MRRNLKSNQTAGRRGPRTRRAKAKAQPKQRQLRPRPAPANRAPAPPHLQHRPIWAALALVANLLFIPTVSMLHLCLTAVLDRIRRTWQDSRWADYWERQYLHWRDVSEAVWAEYGCSQLLGAAWWSGLGSGSGGSVAGHPSSQQCAEQSNAKIKRDLRNARPLKRQQDVIEALEQCLPRWLQPLSRSDQASKEPFSLMGAAGEIHLERPSKPDGWMLYEGARIRKPCSGEMTVFPSIQAILHNFRTLRRNKAHEECICGSTKYLAMAVGTPKKIPIGTLEKMRKMISTKNIQNLHEQMLQAGILYKPEEGCDFCHFNREKYAELWEQFCMVWCNIRPDGTYTLRCSCYAWSWRGHCVHAHSAEQWWKLKEHVAAPIPHAREQERGRARSRSAEAAPPRRRR